MNDCILYMIDICDGCENYGNCCSYLSVNSEKGEEILKRYSAEVEEAIVPVRKKFKEELRKVE